MIDEKSYPQFYILFGGYLNQDSDLWGETVEEVVLCFKRASSPNEIKATLAEIEKFKSESGEKIDEIFSEAYGDEFDPILWKYESTNHFLEELKKILTT
ncbi:hypothetical protein LJ656_01280 [Paraburkholderia sp. MMS20-SJTR3]|uniref:CdiI immunity protein domain-containing protein n=1 Tax=Paraburkholderia sejongensis TaxID=2886946 RepID=A0ABS8JMU8_9BURK|nr:contact-dependent growth inhibition system immunity protein [Paraburkholderia sp. MMS20-SJTR3]MCC8391206.1 hypothetical protein [Paraburkholderia sp. MMS20-SJTR3]